MMKTAAVAALALALSGCTSQAPVTITKTVTVTTEAAPPKSNLPTLSDLYGTCKLDGLMQVVLGDGGSTLSFEMPAYPIETLTVTVDQAVCVALGLEMPSSVNAKIAATGYGDPTASESWENVTLTWKISDKGATTFIYEMAT